MSIKLMSSVWELDLPQHQKMLMLALADFANENGVCWPGQETLAHKCGKSDRSIRNTLRELEQAGYLNVIQRGITGKKSGGRQTNLYFLRLPEVVSDKVGLPEVISGGFPEVHGDVTGSPLPTNHQEPSIKDKTLMSGKPDQGVNGKESKEILDFLNEKTGRNYQPVTANLKRIEARLKEYGMQPVKSMIALKTRQWIKDEKMNQFLRPKTLFSAENCANYMGELHHED